MPVTSNEILQSIQTSINTRLQDPNLSEDNRGALIEQYDRTAQMIRDGYENIDVGVDSLSDIIRTETIQLVNDVIATFENTSQTLINSHAVNFTDLSETFTNDINLLTTQLNDFKITTASDIASELESLNIWKNSLHIEDFVEYFKFSTCTNSIQGDGDHSLFLHIRTTVRSDLNYKPKLFELMGGHNYNRVSYDLLLGLYFNGSNTLCHKILRNTLLNSFRFYKSSALYDGHPRVCLVIPKIAGCGLGGAWLKILHQSGSPDTTLDFDLAGTLEDVDFF
jgi:hypothetical protein